MSDLTNPYQTPKAVRSDADEKIIELLLRFKRKLKVVNMLRQDGMSHNDAMSAVNHLTPIAQSIINKQHLGWRLMGSLLLLMGLSLVIALIYYGIFGFFPIIIVCVFLYGSYSCFQRRDLIK